MLKTPLHILIKQYRIITILLLLFFGVLTWNMWGWFQDNFEALKGNIEAAGVFSSLILLSAGALKWGMEHVMKNQHCDSFNVKEDRIDKKDQQPIEKGRQSVCKFCKS